MGSTPTAWAIVQYDYSHRIMDIQTFKNVVFLQFSLDSDNHVVLPKNGIYNLILLHNKKYPKEQFIGLNRGSKIGVKKLKDCTHWGLFDVSNEDKIKVLHTAAFTTSRTPQVIRFRNHYAIMKNRGETFFTFVISNHKSYADMRNFYKNNRTMKIGE